jgi:hypothetical protein
MAQTAILGEPCTVPEIIDPVFAKTSPKRSFSMTEHERFGLVFTKTRVYKFGHWSHFGEMQPHSLSQLLQVAQ